MAAIVTFISVDSGSSASPRWRTTEQRSTWPDGRTCCFISIRDSDRRSSTSRLIRVACCCITREEALARLGVVARRPLQGLDEAGERRQRRAQFVAGVGDEIDPDALAAVALRQVVEDQRDEIRLAMAGIERREPRGEPAFGRNPLGEIDAFRRPALGDPVEGREEVGNPEAKASADRRRGSKRRSIARVLANRTMPRRSSTMQGSGRASAKSLIPVSGQVCSAGRETDVGPATLPARLIRAIRTISAAKDDECGRHADHLGHGQHDEQRRECDNQPARLQKPAECRHFRRADAVALVA